MGERRGRGVREGGRWSGADTDEGERGKGGRGGGGTDTQTGGANYRRMGMEGVGRSKEIKEKNWG